MPLIVSVMATSHEEFARLVDGVGGRDEVAAIELNVSCPNVHSGLIVGEQPAETAALLEALRPLTAKPLIVKLTPNVADPAAVAVAAEEGGADAVSLINTLKASAIDPRERPARDRRRPRRPLGPGGAAGRASPRCAPSPPRSRSRSIGMGGVCDGADALEFLAAGAAVGRGRDRELPRPAGRPPGRRRARRVAPGTVLVRFRYSTSSRGLGEFDGK